MAGVPNKQSKTKRLVFIPLNQEEEKMSISFKTLCIQDETTQHDMLLEALQLLFKVHNLDLGGNPQLTLERCCQQSLIVEKCKCGKAAVVVAVHVPSNVEYRFCRACFSNVPMRYDAKVWRVIQKKEAS